MSSFITQTLADVQLRGKPTPAFAEIVAPEVLAFIAKLQRAFGPHREQCLQCRQDRRAALDRGEALDFLPETKSIRESDWTWASIPEDLRDCPVEITGPSDRKMVINALNSGAKVFMADFEDANSAHLEEHGRGQINLRDAIRRTINFTSPEGLQIKGEA